ncbi:MULTISPECIES: hypothetical protein [Chryseobacterium]|jgi:hypothetical protein|uniref:YD repeat-containing protein n=1 Tax=Chryseobacterium geocarposphaerae TaxID=1416776 RepID=A0ABU1L995_9FLAO|nr:MULTISPECIES: hypothetical protein [Chryseobacterium]MDR6403286.1 hypothetical protein [Chryseobacterium geocarposphaerae]MDR6696840.1 hypothetical protein [Chryseobacterium ginsenosidimutans]
MKTIKITKLFLIFLYAFVFSQETQTFQVIPGGSESVIKIPNVIPPSPNASFKTDFGNLPMDEYRGAPSVTIPIYNIENGSLKHNIFLNYNKLGVKVNDISDIVGISWLLNVGGVINRTTYDLPDEKNDRFLVNDISSLNIPLIQEGTQEAYFIADKIKNANIDNQVDIFSYSVDNYSGTFYLDANFQPVLLEEGTGVKIRSVGNFAVTHEFILTAPNGVKYYFGGEGFTEETYIRNNPMLNAISGFYLYKIEDGNNSISFSYYTDSLKQISLNIKESRSVSFYANFTPGIEDCSPPSLYQNNIETSFLNIKNTKRIKKITYNNQEVSFEYLPVNGMNYGKLDKIKIAYNQRLEKEIDFSYIDKLYGTVIERFFLEKVQFFEVKNTQKTLNNEYSLEYDDPLAIPQRLSKSIDILGYYNGKVNNTLVPDLALLGSTSFNEPNLADRRANFQYTKKGSLKSITYPTKGKTYFEYESIPTKNKVFTDLNLIVGNNDWITSMLPAPVLDTVRTYQFSSLVNDKIKINLHLFSEVTDPVLNKGKTLFQIIDQSNGQTVYSKEMFLGKIVNQANFETEFTVDKTKNYLIKFKVVDYCNQCNASADISFHSGYEKKNGIGIRLKRQLDINEAGDTVNIKRLYYNKIEDVNNVSLLPDNLYTPGSFISTYYVQSTPMNIDPNQPGCAVPDFFLQQNIVHSEPVAPIDSELNSMFGIFENPIISISYGGDNFEKGGEQKEFIHADEPSLVFVKEPISEYPYFKGEPSSISTLVNTAYNKMIRKVNFNKYNGLLTKSRIFSKSSNGSLLLKSGVDNTYLRSGVVSNYDISGTPIYNALYFPTTGIAGAELHNLLIASNSVSVFFNRLVTSYVTDYIDDVPATITDDSAYKKMVVETNYEYDTPAKLPTKVSTKFSDNTVNSTSYKYANEKGNQLMIDKNMVGIPLETTITKAKGGTTKILSKTETVYPNTAAEIINNSTGLVLPLSVKSFDIPNNTSSVDIAYNKFDEKGNLLQYTIKENVPVAVVWGYNNAQPIAIIEGITYDQLVSLGLIAPIVTASNTDASDPTTEPALITALENFRKSSSLANAKVTTMTYDPLIGVTNIISPLGIRQTYKYDNAGRLERTSDEEAKPLVDFKYNYKN